jgi:hypothetical protein
VFYGKFSFFIIIIIIQILSQVYVIKIRELPRMTAGTYLKLHQEGQVSVAVVLSLVRGQHSVPRYLVSCPEILYTSFSVQLMLQ